MPDTDAYRAAISHFATGVTVVTTETDGMRAAMTASAVASVSLDPTLLLVCIKNRSPTHDAVQRSRRFAVSVLGEGQEALARRFATRSADKFADVRLDAAHDLPILADAVAWFLCDVHERFPGGDHSIFIGRVTDCGTKPHAKPLVYFRSEFGRIDDPEVYLARELAAWGMTV